MRHLRWAAERLGSAIVSAVPLSGGITSTMLGTEVADRFGAAYQRLTGREPQPYFDAMDVVGLLPAPGRKAFVTDPDEQARLEAHLVSVLRRLRR